MYSLLLKKKYLLLLFVCSHCPCFLRFFDKIRTIFDYHIMTLLTKCRYLLLNHFNKKNAQFENYYKQKESDINKKNQTLLFLTLTLTYSDYFVINIIM